MREQLDFEDIQALIFTGYGNLRLARYVFLRVGDPEAARHWLKGIADRITTEAWIRQTRLTARNLDALHIAFTADGLRALGFPEEELKDSFPREFLEGMARVHRSRILGDTGRSAPELWEFGGMGEDEEQIKQKDIHLVLMLFAAGRRSDKRWLEQFHERHRARYEKHGLTAVFHQDVFLMPTEDRQGFEEPFGFRDGITEPCIEGNGPPATHGPVIKPGEFILGYENTYGQKPLSPTVPAAWDAGNALPDAAPGSSRKDLGRNGSYMVIRKLWQNVEAFNAFLKQHGGDDAREQELLAARLMGRWRSGAPLVLTPEQDDKELGGDDSRNNCFAYAQDLQGIQCPVGSHIRRSNPRDALIPGDREASLEVVARHQLIRRGRVYTDGKDAEGRDQRGLFFVALNTNIRRQFEFIQHSWLNSTKFGGYYDSKDPIAGDNPDARPLLKQGEGPPEPCSVSLPGFPVCQRIEGLTRFIEVRGGAYFFLPGIRALRFLSTWRVPARSVRQHERAGGAHVEEAEPLVYPPRQVAIAHDEAQGR
ncbi:Dyp-type peroxidase [Vitiosangium sp. GDMCC 1.1324]|uniref:Dyp-type peroxidase n=1 Tax=Vitiosangium sp. (strain GDMCC 1.1324) TaxID=2138576 RepID=UPI000D3772AA|nr:Dyp-type peroxidase [Vitiosangium sp. GDMCC 1.1324]PTL82788.1 peroxidase [Vitiosangium sp. GDMCC 1.1324]